MKQIKTVPVDVLVIYEKLLTRGETMLTIIENGNKFDVVEQKTVKPGFDYHREAKAFIYTHSYDHGGLGAFTNVVKKGEVIPDVVAKPELRLDFFFAQGLKFINGDSFTTVRGNLTIISDHTVAEAWVNTPAADDNKRFVKHLVARENKGVQPVGDDVVVDVFFGCYSRTVKASSIDWSAKCGGLNVKTWKPNLDALIELQEKPVEREVIGYLFMSKAGLPSSYLSVSDIESSMYTVDELKSRGPGPCRPVYKKVQK